MTVQGTIQNNVGEYWRVQLEWSASQNHALNQSTITANLYWMAVRSGVGRATASAQNAVSITINGDTKTGTANSTLNAGQKKLILSHTVVVPHNSNGTKNVTISGAYNVNAQLSGVWYYNRTVSRNYDLRAIPRESSIVSDANWTAGSNKTVSIQKHSWGYGQRLKFYVRNTSNNWQHIKNVDYPDATYVGSSFTTAENTLIFNILAGRASAQTRLILETFSSKTLTAGNKIGETEKLGTVTAPAASTTQAGRTFNINGGQFLIELDRASTAFSHTVRLRHGTSNLKSYTGVGGSVTFVITDIVNALYNLTPNSNTLGLNIEVVTYYNGALVRSPITRTITARVTDSDPTFVGTPLYRDTNPISIGITGSDQSVISKISDVEVRMPHSMKAVGRNGASIIRYVATLGGVSITRNHTASGDIYFGFGQIQPSTNQTLLIQAVDSRGNTRLVSRTIPIIPYSPPTVALSVKRRNGFEEETIVKIDGRGSAVAVGGMNKNGINSVRYRTRQIGSGTWSGWTTRTSTGFPNYKVADFSIYLDRTKSFEVQVEVLDLLSSSTSTRTVGTGKPIMHIDEYLNSIGFGDFPDSANQVLMNMILKFGANQYASNGGGMDMNNSDIIGANGFWFRDPADNNGEGFLFPKTGTVIGSTDRTDYDNLRILDGVLILNDEPIALSGSKILWQGVSLVGGGEIIPPSRRLNHCPNGWKLIFSRYVNGAAGNSDWTVMDIPKVLAGEAGGVFHHSVAANAHLEDPPQFQKYIYVNGADIRGHVRNAQGSNSGQCLRYVIAY